MPVLDQDGTGLCYAYVASQMLDFEVIKQEQSRTHHPLWIAIKQAEITNQRGTYSGKASTSISALLSKKNCPYHLVDNALKIWTKKANSTEAGLIHLIETYSNNIHTKKEKPWDNALETARPWCGTESALGQIFEDIKKIQDADSLKMFSTILKNTCKDSLLKSSSYIGLETKLTEEQASPSISSQLLRTKAPVGIGLCANIFTNPNYEGVYNRGIGGMIIHGCGTHEVIVVGQRQKNNQCQFLVRNSWGPLFSDATKDWECLCRERSSGKIVDNCKNTTHDSGRFLVEGCWIGENHLKKNVFRTIELKKPEGR